MTSSEETGFGNLHRQPEIRTHAVAVRDISSRQLTIGRPLGRIDEVAPALEARYCGIQRGAHLVSLSPGVRWAIGTFGAIAVPVDPTPVLPRHGSCPG